VPTTTLAELKLKIGQELGVSDWLILSQAQVNAFADLTGDHQYIHVDPARAAQTPFGGTIVHGYFTLSLLPGLNQQTTGGPGLNLGGRMSINYGLNRVRYPSPVPVGKPLRLHTVLKEIEDINPGKGPNDLPEAVQVTLTQTIEVQDQPKPAMVAETLTRVYF
jgi:acyl dehydratase